MCINKDKDRLRPANLIAFVIGDGFRYKAAFSCQHFNYFKERLP